MAKDNPILDMGLLGMLTPNPYINPAYAGKPLKLPGFYTGEGGTPGDTPPTDASGKPIQSFVDTNNAKQAQYQKDLAAYNAANPGGTGTNINSVPASAFADLSARVDQNTINSANMMLDNSIAAGTAPGYSGRGAETGIANYPGAADALIGLASYQNQANQAYANGAQLGMPQAGAGAGGAAPPAPPDLRQDYLNALANPQGIGKPMPVPGATVTQSQPLGVPSVMSAFLAAHPGGGGTGAGAYNNKPFFDTLNKLGTA